MAHSVVRHNLLHEKGYAPYCGSQLCKERHLSPLKGERWPRTEFNGEQFVCPKCQWQSAFPKEFIDEYKKKWGKI